MRLSIDGVGGREEMVELLTRIENDLSFVLTPELSDPKTKQLAAMMAKTLRMIRGELSDPSLRVDVTCKRQRLADALSSILASRLPDAAIATELRREPPSLELLREAVETVLQTGNMPSEETLPVWNALVAMVEAEKSLLTSGTDPSSRAAYGESGSGRTHIEVESLSIGPITVERVNSYLEARSPRFRGWTAQRVDAVAGGFSKTTFIVAMSASGNTVDWVLRRDLGFQPNLSTVADEAPLLTALENRSVLAPRLLWIEPDPAFFGAPVIAMTRLAGSADASIWQREAAQAKSVAEQAAVLLARIHHIPIAEMPSRKTRVPGTQGETPRELVAHLIQAWRSMRLPPNPLMEALLLWLDRNAPATFGPPVLLHGDFGSHNLLVHDGKITGLLDWEFSHVGDPHEDLMSLKPFLEGIMDWGEFIALYESASGFETNAKLERYCAVLVAVRIILGMFRITDGIDKGEPHIDSKLAYIARSYTTTYLVDIAGMVAAPLSR